MELTGQRIRDIKRKGKYLLLYVDTGTVILHLGMSGSLRIVPARTRPQKHDHIDIVFDDDCCLRFHDPRRFGLLIFTRRDPLQHSLLKDIGSEPLEESFHGDVLYKKSRGRRVAIKQFIMNAHNVAGVGNIYANEALYLAGIHPLRPAGRIARERYARLADSIKSVLQAAISEGGTTLRNFVNGDGRPGYFRQHLNVYDRVGQPCRTCKSPVRQISQGQRSTYYCGHCQH